MAWLLDPGGKSVAHRAQKVVSDMHIQLEKQTRHISDLEEIIVTMQDICTKPIEHEINRLEQRKLDLQREIISTDEMITQHKKTLLDIKLKLSKAVRRERSLSSGQHSEGSVGLTTREYRSASLDSSSRSVGREPGTRLDPNVLHKCENVPEGTYSYEDEYEIIETVRSIEPSTMFLLHRSNTDGDVVVYLPPAGPGEVPSLCRFRDCSDKDSAEPVTSFERIMAFGPKITPNHDRDDPETKELPYHGGGLAGTSNSVGELLYAVEIPVASDIVIDIWKVPDDDIYWATTTIQGVKFAVLERIFVMSELRWGFPTVVGIEISGRNPVDGRMLVEIISTGS